MDITQVHGEIAWIESRALDAGNASGDTMQGPLTVPGLILGGVGVSTNGMFYFGTDTGLVNALSVTTSFPSAMAKGQVIAVKIGTTNNNAGTLNVNGLGAYAILQGGLALSGGELPANGWVLLEFDGNYWNVIGMAPGGSPNVDVKMYAFPSGARLIFNQATVPPGWTQDTTVQNDSLLVMTNGAGGGVYAASAVSSVLRGNAGTDGTAISEAQMPSHNHGVNDPGHMHEINYASSGGATQFSTGGWSNNASYQTPTLYNSTGISIQTAGGNQAHSHTLSALNVNAIYNIVGIKQ
jgi:hypothetical protein